MVGIYFPLCSIFPNLPEVRNLREVEVLAAEEIADEKPQVGWSFGKAANKVGIPGGSIWDVDAEPVTLLNQSFL
jgi:hypothetical protein